MASFQKVVLFMAIILFIVILIIIGYSLKNAKSTTPWPPSIGACPDYWVDENGDGSNCVNVQKLGTCTNTDVMDFTLPTFKGVDGACNKYTWATNCGVSWDGITYGVSNPCT